MKSLILLVLSVWVTMGLTSAIVEHAPSAGEENRETTLPELGRAKRDTINYKFRLINDNICYYTFSSQTFSTMVELHKESQKAYERSSEFFKLMKRRVFTRDVLKDDRVDHEILKILAHKIYTKIGDLKQLVSMKPAPWYRLVTSVQNNRVEGTTFIFFPSETDDEFDSGTLRKTFKKAGLAFVCGGLGALGGPATAAVAASGCTIVDTLLE